jgi:hypothetical protein
MPKKSHESAGLTKANRELTAAALRILDANATFGLALIRGEETAAAELVGRGIRVIAVAPGQSLLR